MSLTGRWRVVAVVAAFVLAVAPLAGAAGLAGLGALTAENDGRVAGQVPVHGDDALWLGNAWVDRAGPGGRTEGELAGLARRLRASGIADVLVHVGPLAADGSLNPALAPRARWLVTGLHREVPGLRVQAWLGDLTGPGGGAAAPGPGGSARTTGPLDLDSAASRARVLGAARQVLAAGFDGISYDLDRCPAATRATWTCWPPRAPSRGPGMRCCPWPLTRSSRCRAWQPRGSERPGMPTGGRRATCTRSPAGRIRSR
jgi:hypothetical protein